MNYDNLQENPMLEKILEAVEYGRYGLVVRMNFVLCINLAWKKNVQSQSANVSQEKMRNIISKMRKKIVRNSASSEKQ